MEILKAVFMGIFGNVFSTLTNSRQKFTQAYKFAGFSALLYLGSIFLFVISFIPRYTANERLNEVPEKVSGLNLNVEIISNEALLRMASTFMWSALLLFILGALAALITTFLITNFPDDSY